MPPFGISTTRAKKFSPFEPAADSPPSAAVGHRDSLGASHTLRTGNCPPRVQNRRQREKNNSETMPKSGSRIGTALSRVYEKKPGDFVPACSEIDLTMRFGPLPI